MNENESKLTIEKEQKIEANKNNEQSKKKEMKKTHTNKVNMFYVCFSDGLKHMKILLKASFGFVCVFKMLMICSV